MIDRGGIELGKPKLDRDAALDHLRKLAEKLGRRPTADDVNNSKSKGEGPSSQWYYLNCGGMQRAFEEAMGGKNRVPAHMLFRPGVSREDAIDFLRKVLGMCGNVTRSDVNWYRGKYGGPSEISLFNALQIGDYEHALEASGLGEKLPANAIFITDKVRMRLQQIVDVVGGTHAEALESAVDDSWRKICGRFGNAEP